jgi:hypothetical protein
MHFEPLDRSRQVEEIDTEALFTDFTEWATRRIVVRTFACTELLASWKRSHGVEKVGMIQELGSDTRNRVNGDCECL